MTVNIIYNFIIGIFLIFYCKAQYKKLNEKLKKDFLIFYIACIFSSVVNITVFTIELVKIIIKLFQ